MALTIACRVASYGNYQDRAWTHLPEIGIRHVEIPVPAEAEVEDVRKRLADSGLHASSLQARCDISHVDAAEHMKPQIETCKAFDARICFVSIKAGDTDRQAVWERLRKIADFARSHDVTVAMETHPDLVTNADIARETMVAIDHPYIGVNFDTANIYFYNENRDAVTELTNIIDFVAAVHLKDKLGGMKEWNFPTLGTGFVDFPTIFDILRKGGFEGPCTIELEGTHGQERTEAEQLAYVADSVEYLRSIGAFD
jgi:sugar phosphate isomerase/epimerase